MLKITRDELGTVTHIESDGHVVLTGPVQGFVTLEDGTTYDVTEVAVEVASLDHAAEVVHLIGQRYAEDGHPDDFEVDTDTGRAVPVPFVYDDAHWQEHQANRADEKREG